jgi:hypothetical protein
MSALLTGTSSEDVIVSLLIGCVFGVLGYRMSHAVRAVRGVTPWHLPSALWAVICLFLGPIGFFVELLAQATTKPAVSPPATSSVPQASMPRYPQRAGAEVAVAPTVEDAPPVPTGPPPPAGDGSGHTPLFGWYPDVTGRHEQRYWDGRGWSEHVRDGGQAANDPV